TMGRPKRARQPPLALRDPNIVVHDLRGLRGRGFSQPSDEDANDNAAAGREGHSEQAAQPDDDNTAEGSLEARRTRRRTLAEDGQRDSGTAGRREYMRKRRRGQREQEQQEQEQPCAAEPDDDITADGPLEERRTRHRTLTEEE